MFRLLLLFVHLLAAIAWIGGMFFAYYCLRPAAAETLQPPQRLPLWVETFARFLPFMGVGVSLLAISGIGLFVPVGFRGAPAGWHAMLGLGVVMAGVFVYVWLVLFPQLRAQVGASAWPAAGRVLDRIRQLVALNLALGVCVVAAAVSGRCAAATMPQRLFYFAYGSNMSPARLAARVPSAQLVGAAALAGHSLRFHKPGSRDGSGKCDAFATGCEHDRVLGALYTMRSDELAVLDAVEGLGHGYDRVTVCVTAAAAAGEAIQAQTYVATRTDPGLRPLDWYKEHVLRGARALGLPREYVAAIEAVAADGDADDERRRLELAIYR